MKKELKDYLHLYLGCEVFIESYSFMNGNKREKLIDKLTEVGINGRIDCEKYTPPDGDVKLVLRPLSDMTEEEKTEMMQQKHKYDTGNSMSHTITDHAYRVHWAINKHFDLFGLIEAGLAIDKATLK
jgi:hypothetical protein